MTKQETLVIAKLIEGQPAIRIGVCAHYPKAGGWKFLPSTANHQPSRKYWPEANDCIPAWALDLSTDMFTASEWLERK